MRWVLEASKLVGAFDNVDQPDDEIELFLDVHCSEDKRTVLLILVSWIDGDV